MKETTTHDGFTYVWDQAWYDPITGRNRCRIHFRFPTAPESGMHSSTSGACGTLPEIREVLEEAGFRDVTVYWQGPTSRPARATASSRRPSTGEADAGWITYITALK